MKAGLFLIRLHDEELAMMDECCKSASGGSLSRPELIRTLLYREFLRRTTGKSKVSYNDVAHDIRNNKKGGKAIARRILAMGGRHAVAEDHPLPTPDLQEINKSVR